MTNPVLRTPDGRYIIVNGRLWRASNPGLSSEERALQVTLLMDARRAVGRAKRQDDGDALRAARAQVDAAKHSLGERGPVWWTDDAPDLNRHMARTTVYARWYAQMTQSIAKKKPAEPDENDARNEKP